MKRLVLAAVSALAVVAQAFPAAAQLTPPSLEFGDVPFGTTTAAQDVTIAAPPGAAFKTIFGTARFKVVDTDCVQFQSTTCTASIAAANVPQAGPPGRDTDQLLVQYTAGEPRTEYIIASANFLPPPPPEIWIAINDVAVTEGNTGTTTATFTLTRSGKTTGTSSVKYSTVNGSATAGSDYVAKPLTTVTFAAGETTKTIAVTINGDTVDEPNETFSVLLSAPTGATVSDASGTGTIVDNDAPTHLAINDVSVAEGNSGTRSATLTITRSGNTTIASSVKYSTVNGSATAGSDYVAKRSRPSPSPPARPPRRSGDDQRRHRGRAERGVLRPAVRTHRGHHLRRQRHGHDRRRGKRKDTGAIHVGGREQHGGH